MRKMLILVIVAEPISSSGSGVAEFAHLAEQTGLYQLDEPARVRIAMPLISHLCGDFVFTRDFRQLPRLKHGVRERFLAINVFAHLHRHQGCRRVHVIGRGNRDAVEVLAFLVEHHAEILEPFRLRIFFECARGVDFVHVAKGIDVFAVRVLDVAGAFAPGSDAAKVEAAVGAEDGAAGDEGKGQNRAGDCGVMDELAASDVTGFHNRRW